MLSPVRKNTLYIKLKLIQNNYFTDHMKNRYKGIYNEVFKDCEGYNNKEFEKNIISIDSQLDQLDKMEGEIPTIKNKNKNELKKIKQKKNKSRSVDDNFGKKDINNIKEKLIRGNMENEVEDFLKDNSYRFDKVKS